MYVIMLIPACRWMGISQFENLYIVSMYLLGIKAQGLSHECSAYQTAVAQDYETGFTMKIYQIVSDCSNKVADLLSTYLVQCLHVGHSHAFGGNIA